MMSSELLSSGALERRLAEADATIAALLSGQIDAVIDPRTSTPLLLSAAQSALRESEERYRHIVETTHEGIWTLDADTVVTFVNQRLADLMGYAPDEMVGQSVFEFFPEFFSAPGAPGVPHLQRGHAEEEAVAVSRRDGSKMWALIKTRPICDTNGKYVGILAMMTDWTRHRDAEEALRRNEEQYRQIVETTTDGIVKVDASACIVFTNRRFAEMLGYEPNDIIGMHISEFSSEDAPPGAPAALLSHRPGEKNAFDTSYRRCDGTLVSVNIASVGLFDEGGLCCGSLAVVRDVTNQRRLQSQLMVSDRMASVGTLAAGVAHEINNPLTALIGNLEYINECMASTAGDLKDVYATGRSMRATIPEPLQDAIEAAQRIRFIVHDLKMFSRAPVDVKGSAVDVIAIMESSLRMAWNEIRHRAQLVKEFSPVAFVDASEARLGQVFLNLIMNAAQAIPEGHADENHIRVGIEQTGARVTIAVHDTGAGIPPENIGRVFDAFFTTKAVGIGTGLGLAICHRIVTDIGGELTVESLEGRGTTFCVSLPASECLALDAPTGVALRGGTGRRGRVLIVDDEEILLRLLSRSLASDHDVVALSSGKDALALCAKGERFDMILCDLMMPEMTGMDLCSELARVAPEQADRMVFMTGGAFTARARAFLDASEHPCVEKPFERATVLAILERHILRSPSGDGPA
ncbi:MAG: sensor histidine kinase/response regulator [Gemmatimonadetes bacterium]|nr:sensor histidine kinase/response regulator [Gemmatimonadota bacterium]